MTFDVYEWMKRYYPDYLGERWRWFGCDLPLEVMDELTQFIFPTWSEAMAALKRAAWSAWHRGWRPA